MDDGGPFVGTSPSLALDGPRRRHRWSLHSTQEIDRYRLPTRETWFTQERPSTDPPFLQPTDETMGGACGLPLWRVDCDCGNGRVSVHGTMPTHEACAHEDPVSSYPMDAVGDRGTSFVIDNTGDTDGVEYVVDKDENDDGREEAVSDDRHPNQGSTVGSIQRVPLAEAFDDYRGIVLGDGRFVCAECAGPILIMGYWPCRARFVSCEQSGTPFPPFAVVLYVALLSLTRVTDARVNVCACGRIDRGKWSGIRALHSVRRARSASDSGRCRPHHGGRLRSKRQRARTSCREQEFLLVLRAHVKKRRVRSCVIPWRCIEHSIPCEPSQPLDSIKRSFSKCSTWMQSLYAHGASGCTHLQIPNQRPW